MASATVHQPPASPKQTRSVSASASDPSERRPLAPVTPQRNNRANRSRVVSSPLSQANTSPSVIASPFTPITNVYSYASSLASPNSSVSTKVGFSPESIRSLKAKGIADSNVNWRSRAKENGIKVDSDEGFVANALALSSPKADGLPASFLSAHRRSRQALFQAKSSDGTAFITPLTARITSQGDLMDASISSSVLTTPEQRRASSGSFSVVTPSPRSSQAIAQRLRQRGSLTDPAHPRRRHISGPLSGEQLFDIDEDSAVVGPYPTAFGSPIALRDDEVSEYRSKRVVSAPFIAARFYEGTIDEDDEEFEDDGLPSGPRRRVSQMSLGSTAVASEPADIHDKMGDATESDGCSVCSASSAPLSTLIPCGHLICSSCLTGALNIVGEKDLRCGTCDEPVRNFKLLAPLAMKVAGNEKDGDTESMSTLRASSLLPSAFESLSLKRNEPVRSARTSEDGSRRASESSTGSRLFSAADGNKVAVLRIDNVPWDVTPASLAEFFAPHQLNRAHVLLDPKGKTLSHAFVELPAADSRNALRSVQNKSLGKGRRLRGVTVTMSSESELMRALFPSWLGGFEGIYPSLDGLDHAAMARTLETGLITLSEIDGLIALMKNPKSHFLKVPSLPFSSLTSIISKFPTEGDGHIFWNAKLRELLYDLTTAACDLLIERINTDLHDQAVLDDVCKTAVTSRLFTRPQRHTLHERISDGLSAKGGKITGTFPEPSVSALSPATSHEDDLAPEDSASTLSTSSYRRPNAGQAQDQRMLGFGRPSKLSRMANHFQRSQAQEENAILQAHSLQRGIQAFPQMLSPQLGQLQGLSALNMNAGMMGLGMGGMPFSPIMGGGANYNTLAHEFGVEPDVVAALAQRLAFSGQHPASPNLGFMYGNMRM